NQQKLGDYITTVSDNEGANVSYAATFNGEKEVYYVRIVPAGWKLITAADFNNDTKPDYVLVNPNTRQSAIWYLNNNIYLSGAYGPTISSGWELRAAADFNRDNHPDYSLFNSATQQTAVWYLSGPIYLTGAYGPTLPAGWKLVGIADFDGNG